MALVATWTGMRSRLTFNKFMALLQEKSELKERIRELEDIKNDNPYQKLNICSTSCR